MDPTVKILEKSCMKEKVVQRQSRSERDAILQSHPNYSDPQIATFMFNPGGSNKCQGYGCNEILKHGDLCIQINGCTSIPLYSKTARIEKKYFCPKIDCLKSPPVWTNVRHPTEVQKGALVADALVDDFNALLSRGSMA